MTDIKQTLSRLDPADDSQWTGDGLPRLEVVERLSGLRGVKRQMVTEADPELTRETAAARLRERLERSPEESGSEPDDGTAEEVEDELSAAQSRLSKARDHLRLAKAEFANATAAVDAIISAREQATPRQDSVNSIQHYLDRQRAVRAERVRRLTEGQPADDRAQIDRAMGRKTGHGLNRPQRPPAQGAG